MTPVTTTAAPPSAEDAILMLCAARGPGKSICPTEAARALAPDPGDGWRRRLPEVRAAAVRLAQAGRLRILRKGRPVDPSDFKGVYRLQSVEGA